MEWLCKINNCNHKYLWFIKSSRQLDLNEKLWYFCISILNQAILNKILFIVYIFTRLQDLQNSYQAWGTTPVKLQWAYTGAKHSRPKSVCKSGKSFWKWKWFVLWWLEQDVQHPTMHPKCGHPGDCCAICKNLHHVWVILLPKE